MVDFKKLEIWKRSHAFVLLIYQTSNSFPNNEMFGLTSQLRRASVSISSNIVEGCGRNSDGELARFFVIAMGSAAEVGYQIILAKDLGYINLKDFEILNDEITQIRKMLNSFISKVNARK